MNDTPARFLPDPAFPLPSPSGAIRLGLLHAVEELATAPEGEVDPEAAVVQLAADRDLAASDIQHRPAYERPPFESFGEHGRSVALSPTQAHRPSQQARLAVVPALDDQLAGSLVAPLASNGVADLQRDESESFEHPADQKSRTLSRRINRLQPRLFRSRHL